MKGVTFLSIYSSTAVLTIWKLTKVYNEKYQTGSNFNWDEQLDPAHWWQQTVHGVAVVTVSQHQQRR